MLRFGIDFGTIFHDFLIILASFFDTFSASILVSIFASIFDRFWLQNGSQNRPLGHHLQQKNRLLASLLSHRSVLEPTLRPTSPKITQKLHFYRFWTDFGPIFQEFGRFWINCWWILADFWSTCGATNRRNDNTATTRTTKRQNNEATNEETTKRRRPSVNLS